MAIFVTGGAGFIGSRVRPRLGQAAPGRDRSSISTSSPMRAIWRTWRRVADQPAYRMSCAGISAIADQVARGPARGLRRGGALRRRIARRPQHPERGRVRAAPMCWAPRCCWMRRARRGSSAFCTFRPMKSAAASRPASSSARTRRSPQQPLRGQQGRRRAPGARRRAHLRHGRLITRTSNNYGPYQFPEKLIPLAVSNAHRGPAHPRLRRRPPGARLDPRGRQLPRRTARCSKHGRPGATYHVGGGNQTANLRTPAAAARDHGQAGITAGSVSRTVWATTGATRWTARGSVRELGWKPEIPLDDGLRATVAWYDANREWIGHARSGEYRQYYDRQYGKDLTSARGSRG